MTILNIDIKFKINKPNEEFLLGVFCHSMTEYEVDDNEDMTEIGSITRLMFGFLIFSIELYYR